MWGWLEGSAVQVQVALWQWAGWFSYGVAQVHLNQQLVWQKSWLLGKCCSVQDGIAATLGSEAPEGAEEMRLAGCQLWAEALLVLSTVSVCHANIQAVCLNSLLWASVHALSCWCDGERGPWSHIHKCHLGGDTGVILMQFSDVAGQFMPHREKKIVVQIWFSCCAWEKVVKDSLRWQCCVTVSCHSVSKRGLSVLFRTPQQITVVLAQVLAAWKTGEWSDAFCVLEALLALRSGLMVINTGAPERMGGKEEEEDEGNVYLSLPPTQGMAELLHNTTGNHLRNKISCSSCGRDGVPHQDECVSPWGGLCVEWGKPRARGAVGVWASLLNCGWDGCCFYTWTANQGSWVPPASAFQE